MFWLRYLICAVVVSVAIYYLAPMAKTRLPEVAEEIGDMVAQMEGAGDEVATEEISEPKSQPKQIKTLREPKNFSQAFADKSSQDNAPAEGKEEITKDKGYNEAEVAAQPEKIDALPKSPNSPVYSTDVIPPSSDKVISWAILCNDSAAFRESGKRIPAKAPGGHLVEISEGVRTTEGEEIARCMIWNGSKWFGPYLVRTYDLLMFKDGRDLILAKDVDNLLEYYRLNTKLVNRKSELDTIHKSKNPYYSRLRDLSEKYNKTADRAKELVRIRDNNDGQKRIKAAEELRKLEVEQTRQKRELDQLVKVYNQWKQDNYRGEVDYSSDKTIIAITQEMNALKPKVIDFGVE